MKAQHTLRTVLVCDRSDDIDRHDILEEPQKAFE